MHFDPVIAQRTDHRLSHAERVDASADDFDRLVQLFFALVIIARQPARGFFIDLEREGHAALQIETELQTALGATQQFSEQNFVSLGNVLQRLLQFDLGKINREIDFSLGADLLQRDKFAGSGASFFTGGSFIEQLGEFGRLGFGVLLRIGHERDGIERDEFGDRPRRDEDGEDDFPGVAFEHVRIG